MMTFARVSVGLVTVMLLVTPTVSAQPIGAVLPSPVGAGVVAGTNSAVSQRPDPGCAVSSSRRCRSGYVLRKLRAKEGSKVRTVKRCCPSGTKLKQFRFKVAGKKRYRYKCVKPTSTTPPPPSTQPPVQQDPKARFTGLIAGKKFIYVSSSTVGDVSAYTEILIDFCTSGTFNYRYQYSGTYSFTEKYASGTWSVQEAVFKDADNAAEARVGFVSNNPDALASGSVVITFVGGKVYLDGTEYAYQTGSC